MKFILVLHLCSVITGKCMESSITGMMFKSHYDCAIGGYSMALHTFKHLKNDDYYGIDRINEDKIAIKFDCRELPST